MPHFAYINGKFVRHADAKVHVEDRGFQFADGIYDIIACIDGTIIDEGLHFDRMERSLRELKMGMPLSRQELSALMYELVKKNKTENASICIQITRGAVRRNYALPDPKEVPQTVVITSWEHDFDKEALRPLKVATVRDIRAKRRDIKSTALVWQVLAKQQAFEAGADDAWLVDDDGFVTEGASNNAWIVKNNVIQTRPLSNDILSGITRMAVMKAAKKLNLQIVEKSFTPEEASRADEAFSTGAIILIRPVLKIDGNTIGNGRTGTVTQAIYKEYRAHAAAQRAKRAA